jgi:hypothetical protein
MAQAITTPAEALALFEKEVALSRQPLLSDRASFTFDINKIGCLDASPFADTDDEDTYAVTPASQLRFVRRLTECWPHPEKWDNPPRFPPLVTACWLGEQHTQTPKGQRAGGGGRVDVTQRSGDILFMGGSDVAGGDGDSVLCH